MMNEPPNDTGKALRSTLMALESAWNSADMSNALWETAQLIDIHGRISKGKRITPAHSLNCPDSSVYCTLVAEHVARLSADLIYATARIHTRCEVDYQLTEQTLRCVLILRRDTLSPTWHLWLLDMLSGLT